MTNRPAAEQGNLPLIDGFMLPTHHAAILWGSGDQAVATAGGWGGDVGQEGGVDAATVMHYLERVAFYL